MLLTSTSAISPLSLSQYFSCYSLSMGHNTDPIYSYPSNVFLGLFEEGHTHPLLLNLDTISMCSLFLFLFCYPSISCFPFGPEVAVHATPQPIIQKVSCTSTLSHRTITPRWASISKFLFFQIISNYWQGSMVPSLS